MKKIFCLLFAVLLLAGCTPSKPSSVSFESMDTFMKIDVYGSEETAEKIRDEICRLDARFDATDENSDIGRLNENGTAGVHDDTAALLKQALSYCKQTEGALDLSVYPLVEEWGFISRDFHIPGKATVDELVSSVDYRQIRMQTAAFPGQSAEFAETVSLEKGMKIDLGAVAKGCAADVAVDIMKEDGVSSGILNLGGTVAAVGRKPTGERWKVGISDPENTASYFGSVECEDKVVATSGNYERYFEQDGKRYCHIIDPKTGWPVGNGAVSVTVISDSGVKSDALSTALFVMGADKAAEYWRSKQDFDYIFLDNNNTLRMTEGAKNSFHLSGGYDFDIEVVGK